MRTSAISYMPVPVYGSKPIRFGEGTRRKPEGGLAAGQSGGTKLTPDELRRAADYESVFEQPGAAEALIDDLKRYLLEERLAAAAEVLGGEQEALEGEPVGDSAIERLLEAFPSRHRLN